MGLNPYAAKGLPHKIEADNTPRAPKEEKSAPKSDVPSGSVNEVLEWVGDDQERAKEALKVEKAGAGRKSLVKGLEEVING